jgi:diacylglycerol kinase family enzyme
MMTDPKEIRRNDKAVEKLQPIHVVITPAAGLHAPVLAMLNTIFQRAHVGWSVSVKRHADDATLQAQETLDANFDVVAVYGGNGSVLAVACALRKSETAPAILPGDTANEMAHETSIPLILVDSCRPIIDEEHRSRSVDVGQINDRSFLLRVRTGAEAKIVQDADRESKNRVGFLAYLWSAAQNVLAAQYDQTAYHFETDGDCFSIEGITCGIVNSSKFGFGNLQLFPDISITDDLLDIVVVPQVDLSAIAEPVGGTIALSRESAESVTPVKTQNQLLWKNTVRLWQGQEIHMRIEPPQVVHYDGDLKGPAVKELSRQILPRSHSIIYPTSDKDM